LGMSITKHLIDMMNGEILVESKPGEGSLFTVRLPQTRCGTSVCGPEIAKNLREFKFRSISLQKKSQLVYEYMPYGKVLIVDDVESNLIVAKGLLMPYGLNIETATSGFEAIEKIKKDENYDIVFMDHMMPKMDGLKTTEKLRDMGYTRPIVALTANAVIGQEEMFLANGFDGFISKPIDSNELNNILIELIRNRKLKQELKQGEKGLAIESGELAAAAVLDLKNAIVVLEKILPEINENSVGGSDMELYITTVHGIKSALANIGENLLSGFALKLEQAGNSGNTAVITAETKEFINALRLLIERLERLESKEDENISAEMPAGDKIFLRDKLNAISEACGKLLVKDAKTAISELKQRTWPREINEIINEISMCLIRGEYTKAASAADKASEIS